MNRRKFIKLMAGTGVAAGVVLATGKLMIGADLDDARQPWAQAGKDGLNGLNEYDDIRKYALSYAILAPNPHNLQPWQVQLVGEDKFKLFANSDLKLPQTDPFDRQLTIGLGCFTEVLSIAAAQRGYSLKIDWFPQGESSNDLGLKSIADIQFVKGAEADELFDQILLRRSNKAPFDLNQSVSEDSKRLLTEKLSMANINQNDVQLQKIKTIVADASRLESMTPRTMKESIDYMRLGNDQVVATPDGIALAGAPMSIFHRLGILNRHALADPESMIFNQGLEMHDDLVEKTSAFTWIETQGNSRIDQINAGRQYLRLNLTATKLGLAMHPMSQSLQEYDEMTDLYKDIHKTLEIKEGARIQMLARLGYAKAVPPSPRWPLQRKLIS
jgi:hypothetical protein